MMGPRPGIPQPNIHYLSLPQINEDDYKQVQNLDDKKNFIGNAIYYPIENAYGE